MYGSFLKSAIEARKDDVPSPSALSDMNDLVSPAVGGKKSNTSTMEMHTPFAENAEPPIYLDVKPQLPLSFLPSGQPLVPLAA
jgi:hypothetical protein